MSTNIIELNENELQAVAGGFLDLALFALFTYGFVLYTSWPKAALDKDDGFFRISGEDYGYYEARLMGDLTAAVWALTKYVVSSNILVRTALILGVALVAIGADDIGDMIEDVYYKVKRLF